MAYDSTMPRVEVDESWVGDAACNGAPTQLFYPEKHLKAVEAKAICSGCPVRSPCLEDALRRNDKHGVWGGCSVEEREDIKRARKAKEAA